MSREPGTSVLAPLKFVGLSEELCFKNLSELLNYLQTSGFAVVPTNITNVQVSVDQPTSTETNNVWFRLNAAGKFLGIYMYDGNTWQQVIYAPNEVIWIHDSTETSTTPPGFTIVSASSDGWTAPQAAALEALYLPPGAGPWYYFAVQYTGF